MSFPKPPEKIVPFNSGPVAPHDIGRQFDEHRRATATIIDFLRTVVRDDGVVKNGTVGPEQLTPDLPELIAKRAVSAVEELLASVRASATQAAASAAETRALQERIASLQARIAASADAMSRASEEVRLRLAQLNMEIEARVSATLATGVLGPNVGGPFGVDQLGAAATAQDYSQVCIDWAEHMPDTIPPNTLAINAITGAHWSSRWWANQAASAFGMMAWWYQGAWPSPGPPSTPLTPTGQPIPTGGMYFNTTTGQMMVWNGSTWVNASSPAKGVTTSLYYLASAGQTVFPLSVADRAGATFAFNQTSTEGLQALVNGVRLEPTYDFTLNTVTSTITFLQALPANTLVCFDVLVPAANLTASGTVNTVLLSPITPDGVKTTFTGLTVAMNGHPTNVAKNEELQVVVNGVIQAPGGAYNASGSTITFAEAPEANALIFITWFGPSVTTQMVTPTWSLLAATSYGAAGPTNPINTTGADLLVVLSGSGPITGRVVTDSYGNTWVKGGEDQYIALFYCQGGTVGPGHTFTVAGGAYPCVAALAFSGSIPNPADQVAIASTSTPAVSGPITPTVPGALVITACGTNSSIPGPPSGFTMATYTGASANFGIGVAYQTQATPAAISATWGGAAPIQSMIMSFKP